MRGRRTPRRAQGSLAQVLGWFAASVLGGFGLLMLVVVLVR